MAQIKTKYLENDAVNGSKFRLDNAESLRARNAADSADVNLLSLDGSDQLVFAVQPQFGSDPTADNHLARKAYVDAQISGISLPSVFELQGNYNASTDSPALDNTDTGVDGYLYYVNVAGSQDFGAGAISFSVGDWVYNVNGTWVKADNNDDVLSVNGQTGVVSLDTDDISEGGSNLYYTQARFDSAFSAKSTTDLSEGTNLYFTDTRAKTAAVVNSTAGNETDQAASVSAMKAYVAANASNGAFGKEIFTLSAGDISNGYVDLAQAALSGSIRVTPIDGIEQEEGVDFTLSVPASVTRVTFAGDLSSLLVAGDKLQVAYSYEA